MRQIGMVWKQPRPELEVYKALRRAADVIRRRKGALASPGVGAAVYAHLIEAMRRLRRVAGPLRTRVAVLIGRALCAVKRWPKASCCECCAKKVALAVMSLISRAATLIRASNEGQVGGLMTMAAAFGAGYYVGIDHNRRVARAKKKIGDLREEYLP